MNRSFSKITIGLSSLFCLLTLASVTFCQSSDQNYPTPVSTNEINGQIKARDIGDSRSTSYFYAFDGTQGDIFINVVTRNFNGDIDIFTAENLRPLTKMVMYADESPNETGRLVYLRKNEHLLLRIEGRTPNDDPASFRIKFAGSFVALAPQKVEDAPRIGRSGSDDNSRTKVNSVGTIVEVKPKSQPVKKAEENAKVPVVSEKPKEIKPISTPVKSDPVPVRPTTEAKKPTNVEAKPSNTTAAVTDKPVVKPTATPERKTTPNPPSRVTKPPVTPEVKAVDPLTNIHLVIQMKTGKVIEKPMSEVLKFSVDKGELTVITKDGNISRYSILDVAKVTIQ